MIQRPSLDQIMVKGDLIITAATSNGKEMVLVCDPRLKLHLPPNSYCNSLAG